MGVRTTTLDCDACAATWWKRFEHLSRDEFLAFARETTCPDCASDEWKLTERSQFAGGPIHPNPPDALGCRIRGFQCRDCHEEFHAWMPEMSPDDLEALGLALACPDCESTNWKLTDTYKFVSGTTPSAPIYYTMVNGTDAPTA